MVGAQLTPHIVILPAPGMGHLIPLAEFAKQLVLHYNFSVTFTIPIDGSPVKAQEAFLASLPKSINSMFLSSAGLDDIPVDVPMETRWCLAITQSLPALHELFKVLTATTAATRTVALVVDNFGTHAFNVAKEFKISPYIFFPSPAIMLSLFFHLPKLDQMYSCAYRDLPEPVKLPGCAPLHGRDLMDPAQDRKGTPYAWCLYHSKSIKLAEGILLNSFLDMEPRAIKAMNEGGDPGGMPPVYPIGPLVQDGSRDGTDGSECLRWLDQQPSGSVLFVSFGSVGVLSQEQQNELALGLELSEQRFMWVIRSPIERVMEGNSYSNGLSIEDPFDFLPEGFLERTRGRGLVVPSWAPQIRVLSHVSTGGFMTHCGWNSTLESVVHGVPLISWPLYAEQKTNAVLLVEDLKVSLRPKVQENGIVGRTEIAAVVKKLMEEEEGKRVRMRMMELRDSAAKVLSEDGSSTKSLSEVVSNWKTNLLAS